MSPLTKEKYPETRLEPPAPLPPLSHGFLKSPEKIRSFRNNCKRLHTDRQEILPKYGFEDVVNKSFNISSSTEHPTTVLRLLYWRRMNTKATERRRGKDVFFLLVCSLG